jgi:hypothetical protein
VHVVQVGKVAICQQSLSCCSRRTSSMSGTCLYGIVVGISGIDSTEALKWPAEPSCRMTAIADPGASRWEGWTH